MARIFYSLAGEGRGHATRVRAVVEALRDEHEVTLFTADEAFELLHAKYAGSNVRLRRIPCLRFHYTGRRLDLFRTFRKGLGYLWGLNRLVGELAGLIREERPDLVVTDFEPALPRAARRCGVPFVSLNHQHFLLVSDLSHLPASLQFYARYMGWVVGLYHQRQTRTIVSSFFFPKLRRGYEDAVQVGTLLRPEIFSVARDTGEHIVAYLRGKATTRVLDLYEQLGRPVKVYGIGEAPRRGEVTFHAIDEMQFLRDLATCDAFIGAAGNQTLGEALFLGKPVLALPEKHHHEQLLNAHFLRASGGGDFRILEEVQLADLADFLDRREQYRNQVDPDLLNGTPKAVAELLAALPASARPAPLEAAG